MPTYSARGAGGSTGGWNMWKGDATLKLSVLSKEAVACDFRNFQRDFTTYIKSGETPTVKASPKYYHRAYEGVYRLRAEHSP